MRAILDQGLLSPLSAPLQTSLTDGIRVESLEQAHSIMTKYLHPFGTPREVHPSEKIILSVMLKTNGDFLLSLPVEACRRTAIPPHNPTIEMHPIGTLGWKLIMGDGVEHPDILSSVGARSLMAGERLAFPLSPIPNMKGAAGFSTSAANHALRSSSLLLNKPRDAEDTSSLDTIIATDRGRFKISCSLGFWVQGDVLHRDGHYAFAPKLFADLAQHRAQLRVDVMPLSDKDTQLVYVDSPPLGIKAVIESVTGIMADNFSRRSTNRKKQMSDFVAL
jgi:hypothetical protein